MKQWTILLILLTGSSAFSFAGLPNLKRVEGGTWKVVAKSADGKQFDGSAFSVYKNYLFTAHHVVYQDDNALYPDLKFSIVGENKLYREIKILSAQGLCRLLVKGVCKSGFDAALVELDMEDDSEVEKFEITFKADYAKSFHGMLSGFEKGKGYLSHSNHSGFSVIDVYKEFPTLRDRLDEENPYYYRGFVQGTSGLSGGPVFNLQEDHKVSSLMSLSRKPSQWGEPIFTVRNNALVQLVDMIPLPQTLKNELAFWRPGGASKENAKTFLLSLTKIELYIFTNAVIDKIENEEIDNHPTDKQLNALYNSLHINQVDYAREKLAVYFNVAQVPGWQRDLAKAKISFGDYYAALRNKELSQVKYNEAISLLTNYMQSSYDTQHYGPDVYNDSIEHLVLAYRGLGEENLANFYNQVGAYSGAPLSLYNAGNYAINNGDISRAIKILFTATLSGDKKITSAAEAKIKRVIADNPHLQPVFNQVSKQTDFDSLMQQYRFSYRDGLPTGSLDGKEVNLKEAALKLTPASVRAAIQVN